jgi:hypothetical protein
MQITPETQAELSRQAAVSGRALERHAACPLEGAVRAPHAGTRSPASEE